MSNVYLLIAATCWALWQVSAKAMLRYISPLEAQAIYTASGLLFVPIYLYGRGAFQHGHVSWTGVWLAIVASALGTTATLAYSSALTGKDVNGAVWVVAAYPILACLLAIPILGETLTWMKVVGLMMVIVGVMVAR